MSEENEIVADDFEWGLGGPVRRQFALARRREGWVEFMRMWTEQCPRGLRWGATAQGRCSTRWDSATSAG